MDRAKGSLRRLSWSRCLISWVVVTTIIPLVWGLESPAAMACTGSPQDNVEAKDGRYGLQGVHSNVLVNNFAEFPACPIARSVGAFVDGNDFVEFGWKNDFSGSGNIPFFHVERGGVVNQGFFTGHRLAFGDDTNDFKLQNGNANYGWALDLNGSYLQSVTTRFTIASIVLTNSERHNSTDTLYAHFHGLTSCISSGCNNYVSWNNSVGFVNTPCWQNHFETDDNVYVRYYC